MHLRASINFIFLLLSAAKEYQAQMYEEENLPTLFYNNNTADYLTENNTDLYHSLDAIATTTSTTTTTTSTTTTTTLSKDNDINVTNDKLSDDHNNAALHIELNENNILFSTDAEVSAALDDANILKDMETANIGNLLTLSTLTMAPELLHDRSLLSNINEAYTDYNDKQNKDSNTEFEELLTDSTTQHPLFSNSNPNKVIDNVKNSSEPNDDATSITMEFYTMQHDKVPDKHNSSLVQLLNPTMIMTPHLPPPSPKNPLKFHPPNISVVYLDSDVMQALQQHLPQPQQMVDGIRIDKTAEILSGPGSAPTTIANSQLGNVSIARAGFSGFLAPFNRHWTITAPDFLTTSTTNTATTASTINNNNGYNNNSTDNPYNIPLPENLTRSAIHATTQAPNANEKKSKQIMMNNDRLQTTSNRATTTTPENTDNFNDHHNNYSDDGSDSNQERLLPHEKLRNYIDDAYIRMPLAIIVDPSNQSLEKTKSLWNRAFTSNVQIQIFLVALNKSGTPFVFHCDNSTQFLNRLNSIKEHNDGNVFNGILYTTNLIPYDSAIFILTCPQSAHSNGVHNVAIALLKKRIRLYLMWHDNTELSENETHETLGGILGEIAIRSGGDILEITDADGESIFQTKNGTINKNNATAFTMEVLKDIDLKNFHKKVAKHGKRETPPITNGGFIESNTDDFSTNALITNPINDVRGTSNIIRFPYDGANDTNVANYKDKADMVMDKQISDNILQKSSTRIEMGLTSQILIKPGEFSYLHFEVTNTGLETIIYDIQVADMKRYLFRLSPRRIILSGGQMRVVTVTISAPIRANEGTTDVITFSVRGGNIITSLKVLIKVSKTLEKQDTTAPTASWSVDNRCNSLATATTCSDRLWSMKINAQDWDSGIMRIVAHPSSGLIYTDDYTVGSSEPIKATYISNCCESKVSLTAYDIAGNQRTYDIDVTLPDDAAIAAISLGAILVVILIILIILCIVWCKRRRSELIFLPTYSSYSPTRRN